MYIAGATLILVGIFFNFIRIKLFNDNDLALIVVTELIGIGLIFVSIECIMDEGIYGIFLTLLGIPFIIAPFFFKRGRK